MRARPGKARRPRRLVGIAELSRPPRCGEFRPGKKFLLVSSRRAVDRSPTQRDEHGAASIGTISNVVVDNTNAIRNTRGRPLWLRYHRLTVGVWRCAARLSLAIYPGHHIIFRRVNDTVLRSGRVPLNIPMSSFIFYNV